MAGNASITVTVDGIRDLQDMVADLEERFQIIRGHNHALQIEVDNLKARLEECRCQS